MNSAIKATKTLPVCSEVLLTVETTAETNMHKPHPVAPIIRMARRPTSFFIANMPMLTAIKPTQVCRMEYWKAFVMPAMLKK
jgi:hypothetical protein